jgi:hypothetical protein
MTESADDFDWVGAQATCNTTSMFERLRTRVREDVNKRNALLDRRDGWRFEFSEEGNGHFEVARVAAGSLTDPQVNAVVQFDRAGVRIQVVGEDTEVSFTAIVTSDATGACRFVVGEAMYSDWEIRKMALEVLFFDDREDED